MNFDEVLYSSIDYFYLVMLLRIPLGYFELGNTISLSSYNVNIIIIASPRGAMLVVVTRCTVVSGGGGELKFEVRVTYYRYSRHQKKLAHRHAVSTSCELLTVHGASPASTNTQLQV